MTPNEPPRRAAPLSRLAEHGQRALAELQAGAAPIRHGDLTLPRNAGPLRRMAHAWALPLALLRIVWETPALRLRYLKSAVPAAIITLVLGLAITVDKKDRALRGDDGDDAAEVESAREEARAAAREAKQASREANEETQKEIDAAFKEVGAALKDDDDKDEADKDDRDDDEAAAPTPQAPPKEPAQATPVAASKEPVQPAPPEPKGSAPDVKLPSPDQLPKLPNQATFPLIPGAPPVVFHEPPATPDTPRKHRHGKVAAAKLAAANVTPPKPPKPPPFPRLKRAFAFWSALYATLGVVEWCLLALTRQHQDQLSRIVSLQTGAEPEDPEVNPRLSVDFPWMMRKVRRRIRGTLIFFVGLVPLYLATFVPGVGHLLYTGLVALWGLYWTAVFTLGRTRQAWVHQLPGEPFYLRVPESLSRRWALFRWWAPQTYLRALRRVTQTVTPASLAFEVAPWEAIGLGAARVICSLPVIYTLTRPMFSVAAALALKPHLPVVPSSAVPAVETPSPEV